MNELGASFRNHVDDTIGLFDSLVRPTLLYGSDFWGCLKLPHNNPIDTLHMHFCPQVLGVQKNTSTKGVPQQLGRTPLVHETRRCHLLKPQFGFYTDQHKLICIMTTPALTSHMLKFLDSPSRPGIFLESKATLDCLLSKVSKNQPEKPTG